jgi:hypothetical protein
MLRKPILGCVLLAFSLPTMANPTPEMLRDPEVNWLCTVKISSGYLRIRKEPGSLAIGSIPNGASFEPTDARYAADGSLWYRTDGDGHKVGWVSSAFVDCFSWVHAD